MHPSRRPPKLPELLPKSVPTQPSISPYDAGPVDNRRRTVNPVACGTCRAKKRKCDGGRPKCQYCLQLETKCEYETDPGETRNVARKRKQDEIKRELDDLRELYTYLRTRSGGEVTEILRRIRLNQDPLVVLRFIRDGDLLLEASATSYQNFGTSELKRLDAEALRKSTLKVFARPWTLIAGDGIVSELISIFFATEHPFIGGFVDKLCFLQDMKSREISSSTKLCSPFLVNAICAWACFTSSTAKEVDRVQGGNLQATFHQEAKRQFDMEDGKLSLATALAAYITCLNFSSAGRDRAGTIFRLASCDMLKRMNLEAKGPHALEPGSEHWQKEENREIASRAAWGLFCQECLSGFIYMQSPLIKIPNMPINFFDDEEETTGERSIDWFLVSLCELSVPFYRILKYNHENRNKLGGEDDIEERLRLYEEVLTWKAPVDDVRQDGGLAFARLIFLRSYFSMVVVALLRPVASLDITLPNNLGSPRAICVRHCTDMVSQLRILETFYPDGMSSGFVGALYICYAVSTTLVGNLDEEPSCKEPFTEACRHFFRMSKYWPVANALLTGLRALAFQLNVQLPEESSPYFEEAHLIVDDVDDIPITYVIPQQAEVAELPNCDKGGTTVVGVELGKVIAKWSSLAL